jgi:hypothetical protein
VEGFEIEGISHPNRGTMISVTPGNIIAVFYETHTWIVGIYKITDLLVVAYKFKFGLFDIPMNGIFTETYMQTHTAVGIVATKHAGISIFKRNNGAIENAVGGRYDIAGDHRVFRKTPHHLLASLGTILPGHSGQRISFDD